MNRARLSVPGGKVLVTVETRSLLRAGQTGWRPSSSPVTSDLVTLGLFLSPSEPRCPPLYRACGATSFTGTCQRGTQGSVGRDRVYGCFLRARRGAADSRARRCRITSQPHRSQLCVRRQVSEPSWAPGSPCPPLKAMGAASTCHSLMAGGTGDRPGSCGAVCGPQEGGPLRARTVVTVADSHNLISAPQPDVVCLVSQEMSNNRGNAPVTGSRRSALRWPIVPALGC